MHIKKKIKILHLTQVGGGIQTYLEQIINNIDTDKYEIILASPMQRNELMQLASKHNITWIDLDLKWQISPLNDLRSVFSIVKIVKEINPDLIHAHSSKAGVVVRLASFFFKKKTFYSPHAYAYLGQSGIKRKILLLIEKFMILFTDTVLATSKSEAQRSINDLNFPVSKVKVYPNSIEIIEPKSTEVNSDKKIVTTVGRLVKQKNPLMFLRVCKLISEVRKDVHFQIIGAGFEDKLKKSIDRFIQENELESIISIIPWMDRADLLKTIANTNVFVMTSEFESFGYVAAESQVLGIPVVATDIDGLNEIVENNVTGYLVNCNDDKAMADKILFLLNNHEQAVIMGAKGRERIIKHFNIKHNIKILESFYQHS